MKRILSLLISMLLIFSCGVKTEEEIEDAIDRANRLLSSYQCAQARQELLGVGQQNTNARWVQTYASTYACDANFTTTNFFANDIDKISATDANFFKSLATFSTASTTAFTDSNYTNLKTAITTLLYPGNVSASSHSNRSSEFSSADVDNMDVQALYMLIAYLGKYFYYIGNVDATGTKGSGTGPNNCLTDYTDAGAQGKLAIAIGATTTGACAANNDGHPELDGLVAEATRKEIMCDAIVAFNNFMDILTNLDFTGGDAGTLEDLKTFETVCEGVVGVGEAVCTVKDQASCETIAIGKIEEMFVVFETLHR